jgi:hypothetical protein
MRSNPKSCRDQSRAVWPPEPGWFALSLVSKAWKVPARIVFEDGLWRAIIDGIARDQHADPAHAPDVAWVWQSGLIIDENTYAWLNATREWARLHDSMHPSLSPRRAIDPAKLEPIIPRRDDPSTNAGALAEPFGSPRGSPIRQRSPAPLASVQPRRKQDITL